MVSEGAERRRRNAYQGCEADAARLSWREKAVGLILSWLLSSHR